MGKDHSPGLCKDLSSLGASLLYMESQLLPCWWARGNPSVYVTSPLSSTEEISSWALQWACDHAKCPSCGVRVSHPLCHDTPWLLPGSVSLSSNSGLAGPVYCIWNLSPYRFGSVQLLSWECLLSTLNTLSNSVNICFLHQHSSFLSVYLMAVFFFLAHFHFLLILSLLNFF